MDFRSSVDPSFCRAMEEADPQCASSMPDALCTAVERASVCQSYTGFCAVEQASEFQGYVGFDDGAATNNLDSSSTADHAHNNTAGTVFDPGTRSLVRPQVPNGTVDTTVEKEAQTTSIPNPGSMAVGPTPGTVNARERSRSPRRFEEKEEPFGLTAVHLSHQFGFRDATLWCWKCGGWSAGSRRASRPEGSVRAPDENWSRCRVPCLWRISA